MLPHYWRFVVYNKSGVTLEFSSNSANEIATVDVIRQHLDPSTGKSEKLSGDPTNFAASTDLVDGGLEALAAVSQETELKLHGTFHVETDNGSAAGPVILGYEFSHDGSTWPSDAANFAPDEDLWHLGIVQLSGAEVKETNIRIG